MKRRQIGKWLMLMVMLLVATVTWGDLAVPPPRVLSHSEWLTAMGIRTSVLPRSVVLYLLLAIFLVIFLVVLIFSRQHRKIYLLLLAWWAPLAFFIPITYEWEEWSVLDLSILGVSLVSCLVPVVYFFLARKFGQGVFSLIVLPIAYVIFWRFMFILLEAHPSFVGQSFPTTSNTIATRDGESYEEYLKRANRIIHHHCDKCDKPMKNYWHDYWRCPDCDKDEMTCSKCGAQKEQEPMGPYWQYGFEWVCPDCDKERREEIKRQVEEKTE